MSAHFFIYFYIYLYHLALEPEYASLEILALALGNA